MLTRGFKFTALAFLSSAPLFGQSDLIAPKVLIRVTEVSSQLDCTVYEESSGTDTTLSRSRTGVYADPFVSVGVNSTAEASFSTWKTWYVKDCVDHFPSLTLGLTSALSDPSGPIIVSTGQADYYLAGSLSATSSETGPRVQDPDTKFSMKSRRMSIRFTFMVSDKRGRMAFSSQVQSHIDEDFQVSSMGTRVSEQSSGEGNYGKLERKIAQAAAREVAFHFKPIKVVSIQNGNVLLNYGSQTLPVGSSLTAIDKSGKSLRLSVIAANAEYSVATPDGNHDGSELDQSWSIDYVDPDGLEANQRRLRKVKLP